MKTADIDLRYELVKSTDLDEITQMYIQYLNSGEPIVQHLKTAFNNPHYLGVKCMDGDLIVGILSADPGITFTYPHQELEQKILTKWHNFTIYTMDIVLVRTEYQGHGIARNLAKMLHDLLLQQNAQLLVVEMWDPLSLGDLPADGIIKYIGVYLDDWAISDFYSDLYNQGMSCPNCGTGPCKCGATICVVAISPK